MKRLIFLLSTLLFLSASYAQDFFNTDFNKKKRYVILCDPTVHRIKTIEYLTRNKIFDVNRRKVQFVGVYFEDQNYDFSKTQAYIEENELNDAISEIDRDYQVYAQNALHCYNDLWSPEKYCSLLIKELQRSI